MSEQLLQSILDTMRDIQTDVKAVQADGARRGEVITEMRTVLLGPDQQPDIGLVAQVARNTENISRIQRIGALFVGVSGAGGATAWNWDMVKAVIWGH